MEQITSELEHRIQVEELWARRNVLAAAMNADRRERFYAKYNLMSRFGALPIPAAVLEADETPVAANENTLELSPVMAVEAIKSTLPALTVPDAVAAEEA